jgi:Mg-chelatase subunit ChlD
MPLTMSEFEKIAGEGGGDVIYSEGGHGVLDAIVKALPPGGGKSMDLVLCIDTTASMKNEMAALKQKLREVLDDLAARFSPLRVGLVFYKDYGSEYITRVSKFSSDMKAVARAINGVQASGGGDTPEAVHEAIYAAATKYDWQAEERLIILIGDAPPHPRPRGDITEKMAQDAPAKSGVRVSTIILPFE